MAAELFAGSAYDPSAAGDAVAWQRPGGVALLARGGAAAAGLPGREPALGAGRIAWLDGGRVVIAEATTLAVQAAVEAPGADAPAVSDAWVAWRARDAEGTDRLLAHALQAGTTQEVAAAPARQELGRPVLAGGLLLFHEAGPRGSRLVGLDLASGARLTLRRREGVMVSNPATDGTRLLWVWATGRTQELRIGPLAARDPSDDAALLVLPAAGRRDAEHEPGRERHTRRPLPPRAKPGVTDTLWTTALGPAHAYVTRIRAQRGAERRADILRVPLPPAG